MDSSQSPSTLSAFVRQHFLVLLLAAYLLASVFPNLGTLLREPFLDGAEMSGVHIMLSVLLFTLGLSTPWREISHIGHEFKWVGSFFLIRAIAACLLAVLSFCVATELTGLMAGFILLLVAPTAASSSGWSLQMGASRTTTAALILGTTLMSVVLGPVLLFTCSLVAAPETSQALGFFRDSFQVRFVVPWVVLPMIAGMTLRSVSPEFAQRVRGWGLAVTPLVLLLLNYSNASLSLPKFATEFSGNYLMFVLVGAVLVFVLLSSASWLSSGRTSAGRGQRVSVLIGTSMSNTGFILLIASLAMPSRADIHLPIIVFTFIQHLGVARLAKESQKSMRSSSPNHVQCLVATKS